MGSLESHTPERARESRRGITRLKSIEVFMFKCFDHHGESETLAAINQFGIADLMRSVRKNGDCGLRFSGVDDLIMGDHFIEQMEWKMKMDKVLPFLFQKTSALP